MNTSKKWLVAIGSAVTLGVVAIAAHANTDEQPGASQQINGGMIGGMHRGMQDGKGPGAMGQGMQGKGMQHMSSEKGTGRQYGMANAGEHRQMADARGMRSNHDGTQGQNSKEGTHQHGQGMGPGEGKGSGEHSH